MRKNQEKKYDMGIKYNSNLKYSIEDLCNELRLEVNNNDESDNFLFTDIRRKISNSDGKNHMGTGIRDKLENNLNFKTKEFEKKSEKYELLKLYKLLLNIEKRGITKAEARKKAEDDIEKQKVSITDILSKPHFENIKAVYNNKSIYGGVFEKLISDIEIEIKDTERIREKYLEEINCKMDSDSKMIYNILIDYMAEILRKEKINIEFEGMLEKSSYASMLTKFYICEIDFILDKLEKFKADTKKVVMKYPLTFLKCEFLSVINNHMDNYFDYCFAIVIDKIKIFLGISIDDRDKLAELLNDKNNNISKEFKNIFNEVIDGNYEHIEESEFLRDIREVKKYALYYGFFKVMRTIITTLFKISEHNYMQCINKLEVIIRDKNLDREALEWILLREDIAGKYAISDYALQNIDYMLYCLNNIKLFLTKILSKLPDVNELHIPYTAGPIETFYNMLICHRLLCHRLLCNAADEQYIKDFSLDLDYKVDENYINLFRQYDDFYIDDDLPDKLKQAVKEDSEENRKLLLLYTGKSILDDKEKRALNFAVEKLPILIKWISIDKGLSEDKYKNDVCIVASVIQEIMYVRLTKKNFINKYLGSKCRETSLSSLLNKPQEGSSLGIKVWVNRIDNRFGKNWGAEKLIIEKNLIKDIFFEIEQKVFSYSNSVDIFQTSYFIRKCLKYCIADHKFLLENCFKTVANFVGLILENKINSPVTKIKLSFGILYSGDLYEVYKTPEWIYSEQKLYSEYGIRENTKLNRAINFFQKICITKDESLGSIKSDSRFNDILSFIVYIIEESYKKRKICDSYDIVHAIYRNEFIVTGIIDFKHNIFIYIDYADFISSKQYKYFKNIGLDKIADKFTKTESSVKYCDCIKYSVPYPTKISSYLSKYIIEL